MGSILLVALAAGGVVVYSLIQATKAKRAKAAYEAAKASLGAGPSYVDASDRYADASDVPEGSSTAEDEADLNAQSRLAMVVRDKARWARSYAADMRDAHLPEEERENYRQRYEKAKSSALVDAATIRDDFYRGVAIHGVIDLFLAGGEVDEARKLLSSLDETMQTSIVGTDPDSYARLRG